MKKLAPFFCLIAFASTSPFISAQDADEVTRLTQRIELLEAKLKAVTLERDGLQKQLDERAKGDKPLETTQDPTPLGSSWKGKFLALHLGKSSTSNAEFQVTARDDKKVTFLQTIENGAIWEFDCEYTGAKKFKIVAVRRVRAANAVVNDPTLPPVGGVTGAGSADEKKLTLQFVWRDAKDGPLSGKFELAPDK